MAETMPRPDLLELSCGERDLRGISDDLTVAREPVR